MTESDINKISRLIEKYSKIANEPDDLNNIVIDGHVISIIENGVEIYKCELDINSIRKKLDNNNGYVENVFYHSDSIFSPFEADRDENKCFWVSEYNNISFPYFISVLLFSLLAVGELPTIMEFCKIYLGAYTEIIDVSCSNPKRNLLYAISNNGNKDRARVGKIFLFDNVQITNNLLRFKNKYISYLKDFPINEFTVEHICSRIYKAYGSIIRDIFNVLYFDELGQESYYSFLEDLGGIDLMLNGIPIFAYTNTKASQEFRQKKRDERHPELSKIGIALESTIGKKRKGKVYLIKEKTALEIIEKVNYLKESGKKEIIRVEF